MTEIQAPERDPRLDEGHPDGPEVAHIARKGEVAEAYVTGKEITALCGERFVPTRDPEQYPVCEACMEQLQRIRSRGAN